MYARSTTISGDPNALDAGISFVQNEVMPTILAVDGCVGMSLVADRETGRIIATSSWESQEAMAASRDQLAPLRSRGGEILGGSPEIEEWEVVVMHRDHPTTDGSCCRITWARPRDLDRMLEMSALGPAAADRGHDGIRQCQHAGRPRLRRRCAGPSASTPAQRSRHPVGGRRPAREGRP